ncbi:hypothetical protein, partial [Paenibacillus vini]|uniref:hypothetical protein n=1 Tax=Paenibacillus vini TaxID=1476024 RepID=UPI001BCE95F1
MPSYTTRLGLGKYAYNEPFDIAVLNRNADILDEQVVAAGTDNKTVNSGTALNFPVDTRGTHLTYTAGRLTKVEEKDGSAVVKATIITYDGNGRVATIKETAGGKTVT